MSSPGERSAPPSATASPLDARATGLVLLLCTIWGLNQVAIKAAIADASPLVQSGLRSGGAAVLLAAWCVVRGIPLARRDRGLAFGLSLSLLFGAEFACIYGGLAFTTASRSVLFLYTVPFWVALGAHWRLPGERLHGARVAGLAAAFTGIALAFTDALRLPSRRELIGDVIELAAAMLWAAGTLLVKARGPGLLTPHQTVFYQLAGSAPTLLGLAWLAGEPGITRLTPVVVASLAYQTVVIAFATYLVWYWMLGRYAASSLTAFTFLTPILGLVAGAVILGEPVSRILVVAMALVAAGIYLVNRSPRPA